jgi:RNA recognition motif-containing protein
MSQNQKLYVGSLPYKTTEEELFQIFSQFGAIVSVKIVTDRVTGQSKGFGFVEMEKADDAQKAIEAVNGSELGGRTLVVSIARPPQERERGGGGGGGGREEGGFQRERRYRNR